MALLPPLQQSGFGPSRWRLQGNATLGLRAGGRGHQVFFLPHQSSPLALRVETVSRLTCLKWGTGGLSSEARSTRMTQLGHHSGQSDRQRSAWEPPPACYLQRKSVAAASVNAELLGRHFGSGNAVCDLLERDVARIVRRAVIGLGVDAERREATIVGRAEALLVDIFGGSYQLIANFLRRFRARALRHNATDVGHLRDPICILP